jgi:hypothetical protein
MDFLVTVIGNAAVDYKFRKALLKNPRAAIDKWGFRLTKGEVEMMLAMFGSEQKILEERFKELEDILYDNLNRKIFMCDRPCRMSVSHPVASKRVLKEVLKKAA